MREPAIPQMLIEELGFFIAFSHFQGDAEYARDNGAFLEPLKQSAPDACPSKGRSHGKKVQMCVVVSITHDGKPGNLPVDPSNEYVNIGGANTRCHTLRCPTPNETVFD